MKRFLLLIFLAFSSNVILAQEICDNGLDDDGDGLVDLQDTVDCNCSGFFSGVTSLIPNPSFEDTFCCPSTFSMLHCAEGWIQASDATTDYHNLCGFTHIGGYRPPPLPIPGGGNGYAGFYNYGYYDNDGVETYWKEMLGACLLEPVQADSSYRISMFLARGWEWAHPLVVSIYGSPHCSDLPWTGTGCPVGIGSWIHLGADTIEFTDSSWQQTVIQFSTPVEINAIAIGGPCGAVPGNIVFRDYFYIDELTLARATKFDRNARITEFGEWCSDDLKLHAGIDTAGGTWQWYRSGIALPGETADTLDVMPYGTGAVYTAVYTLGGECVTVDHTVESVFFQGNIPELIARPSCKGSSNGLAFLDVDATDLFGFTYQWRADGDTTVLSETDSLNHVPVGGYSLQITQGTHCDTMLYFDIPEEDFRVSFMPDDTLICTLDTVQFINTSDAHFMSYQWTFGHSGTFSGVQPPSLRFPEPGVYKVRLSGIGLVCMDTTDGTIRVDQPLLPAFEVEPNAICVGRPVYFSPKTDSTTIQIAWEMEDQLHIESDVQQQYQHAFTSIGAFPVTLHVESRACPDAFYTDSITVYPLPEIDLGTDSSLCLDGAPVYLKNLRAAPLTPYRQVWSTGDTTAVLEVVHPGIYTLNVTAEPIGCTTTESIEVIKDCYIDIPNAFTPNGDGHNDYFLPRQLLSESLVRFRMQIFNRWGQLVFETTRLDGRGWDGRFNNTPQPMGVYVYRIEADFANDRQERYEGNVTLMR